MMKPLAYLAYRLLRRARGLFGMLFVVDDFIRMLAMTLLLTFLATALRLPPLLIAAAAVLGMVIDIHDFMAEARIARINQ